MPTKTTKAYKWQQKWIHYHSMVYRTIDVNSLKVDIISLIPSTLNRATSCYSV